MQKNGFVSTSLIYTFFIIFLTMMLFVINSYSENRNFLKKYKEEIRNNFVSLENDITINYRLINSKTNEYEDVEEILDNYIYVAEDSYCENNSKINYEDKKFTVEGNIDDVCYLTFKIDEAIDEVR